MKLIYTDVLVIGGGLAGLRIAIGAKRRGHDAIILSLVPPKRSHSAAALGGMQAGLANVIKGQGDNEDVHFEDTVRGSDWGADQHVVRMFVNTAPLYGSEPNSPTARKIGAYLMWTAFATTCLTSAMFLTGLAPNLLALSLVKTTAKVDITWTEWFMGMAPVGLLLFIFLPLIVYKVYPPELKSSPGVPVWAAGELKKMGAHYDQGNRYGGVGATRLGALDLWRRLHQCHHCCAAGAVADGDDSHR